MRVLRLDETGGEVMVEPASSYRGALESWNRRVTWDADHLEVEDEVAPAQPEILNFRWHLGTRVEPEVTGADWSWKVSWPAADLEIQANEPLAICLEWMSDYTLAGASPDEQAMYPTHVCVVVRTQSPVARAQVSLRVVGKA